MKFGQNIRSDGPARHLAKAGTPTMGGVIILAALIVTVVFFGRGNGEVWLTLFITIGHGIVGFIDDFIKVVLKRSLGLRAYQKLLGQIVLAAVLSYVAVDVLGRGTDLWVPFVGMVEMGSAYYVLLLFVLLGTTNGVNLTDGLDGLAAGTTLVAVIAYAAVAMFFGKLQLAVFCAALAGAIIGFLRYNLHPAKVFMGDTGSLALGGALASVAVLTKTELLLVVIGGIFVIETLSVIIQVISFKSTGRRVFKMSPFHHHFELCGWKETKVVTVFWGGGIVCAVLGIALLLSK